MRILRLQSKYTVVTLRKWCASGRLVRERWFFRLSPLQTEAHGASAKSQLAAAGDARVVAVARVRSHARQAELQCVAGYLLPRVRVGDSLPGRFGNGRSPCHARGDGREPDQQAQHWALQQ